MANYRKLIEKIIEDPRYQENIEYGEPRPGHPEGKLKYHIAELEENLEALKARGISEEGYWKLKFMIHVHDTFKKEAVPGVRILGPLSHASLAKEYASQFVDDLDLLNMIQFHDENFALWKQYHATGSYDVPRFTKLLETIQNWNLFLMFLIIDGSTKGKERASLRWFMEEVRKYQETVVDESWILG
ncbi:MAG: hypothetical protein JNM55_06765 [Anaerolineales bacterium]|nr:hypothetical protein [Anaerolineales bacterium]